MKSIEDIYFLRTITEENNSSKPNFSQIAREFGISCNTAKKRYYSNGNSARKKKSSKVDLFYNRIYYISVNDLLIKLCEEEIQVKDMMARKSMIKTAGFPCVKTIEEFDFTFKPSINKQMIEYLSKLSFINEKEKVILTGSPGVGKTHLAISQGVKRASKRISTYFIKAEKLLNNLELAYDENRLEARLKQYNRYKVLIIDELGFLPINKLEAKLLFQLIELRYESKSTIVTSNISIDRWDEIFDDIVIANAITDRLVHHASLFNINGKSYRMKHFVENDVSTE